MDSQVLRKIKSNIKVIIKIGIKVFNFIKYLLKRIKYKYIEITSDKFFLNSPKRKILLVFHDLSNTGAPIVLSNSIDYFIQKNLNIYIYSRRTGPLIDKFQNNIDVHSFIGPWDLFYKMYFKYFKKFDLAICNTICSYQEYKDISGYIETIWWTHESGFLDSFFKDNPRSKDILKNAKNIYSVSEYAKNSIEKYCNNVHLFRYGINDEYENYKNIKRDDNRFVICYPASIFYLKGQDILIEAVENLSLEIRESIVINFWGNIGNNEYFNFFQQSISGKNYYSYLGELDHKESLLQIMKSDCLIMPSRGDSYPVVIMEALMLGKTVVASKNTGSIEYIQNGINGYIFDEHNTNELMDIIKKIVVEKKIIDFNEARNLYMNRCSSEYYCKEIEKLLVNHIHI